MKKYLSILLLVFSTILTACQIKQDYPVEYGFSSELLTQTILTTVTSTVSLQTPFADFSCDLHSFSADVERQSDTFTVLVTGNETQQRCSEKFSLKIHNVPPGSYWLKVLYRKSPSQEQQVVYQQFSVVK